MAINIDLNSPAGAKRIRDIFERRTADLMRVATHEFFRQVIVVTPVDTGRARFGWCVAINSIPDFVPPVGNYSLPPMPELGTITVKDTIYIANNLPYIVPLNNGHSKQAPARFVEMVAARVQNTISIAAKNIK